MKVLKNLAITTVTVLSLGTVANVASAEIYISNGATTTDSMATLINSLPKQNTTAATPATTKFASFGATNPTTYYPTNIYANTQTNQPSFFNNKVQGLIAKAKTLIGLPYRFGGTSPVSGFDCSGFMQYIFKQTAGISLPRRSEEMASSGHYVSRDQLQAGDMVFFKTHGSSISHVGMYIGDNQFIHAPRTGKSIEITSLGNSYWAKTFATARRVLSENA